MTNKRMKLTVTIGLLLSFWVIAATSQLNAKEEESSSPKLEGSWNVVVGPGSPTEFRTLVTYDAGGGYVATAPVLPPPFHGSTAHGTWEKTGHHRFTYTFLSLVYLPAGQFVGTLKVRETITLNRAGNEYNGTSSVEVSDPAGNLLPQFSSCGSSHGTRINVEPPSCP